MTFFFFRHTSARPDYIYYATTSPVPFNAPYFEHFRDGFSADEIRSVFPCEGVAPPSRTCEAREKRELVHRSVIPFKEGH